MSALADQVVEYLALRRSLGFALVREEQMLGQFVAYLEAAGAGNVRSELAIAWAQLPATASPNHWAKRLGVVRRFAVYLRTIEETTEVPPPGVFPTTRRRPAPYLFSERDVERVLKAARALASPLRAATHEALFGLLAASGMRIGEALGLARGDVDLGAGVITIRHAKFDRARLVPLHESSTTALRTYAAERDRLCPRPCAERLLLLERRHRPPSQRYRQDLPGDHDRARPAHRHGASARARSAPRLCRAHARQLAAVGGEHRPPSRDAVGLSRPRRPVRHLLVSVGRSGADGARRTRLEVRFGSPR